jgi:polyisoprenoid-binding protein YceI
MKAAFLLAMTACAWGETVPQALTGSLRLEVEKTGVLSGKKHDIRFDGFTGKALYDPANPERSSVELIVDAAKLTLLDGWVSESDRKKIVEFTRGPEMLDVKKYPAIRFVSNSVAAEGAARFSVKGLLTVRGVTQTVVATVDLKAANGALTAEGESRFKLTQFKLKPPSALLGAIGTKDEVVLRFSLVLKAVP